MSRAEASPRARPRPSRGDGGAQAEGQRGDHHPDHDGHHQADEGEQQEELYLVVEGRARFVCDGEEVELSPGDVLLAKVGVKREAVALETPTMLFIVGGRPGKPYAPPLWSRAGT